MRAMHGILAVMTACALLSAGAPSAQAQGTYVTGGYLMSSFPMGDWGEIAGFGLGVDGTNIVRPQADKPLAIRSSLGWVYNFSRTQDVPQSNLGPSSALSLETKNMSLFFGVGPELGKADGPVRPFVFGTVGFNTYWTSSNMSGTAGGTPFYGKFGDSRIAFAWSAGAGIRKSAAGVPGGMMELSAEWRSGGGHMYILPDEVTNTGSVVNVSREARTTDQLLVRVGSVF